MLKYECLLDKNTSELLGFLAYRNVCKTEQTSKSAKLISQAHWQEPRKWEHWRWKRSQQQRLQWVWWRCERSQRLPNSRKSELLLVGLGFFMCHSSWPQNEHPSVFSTERHVLWNVQIMNGKVAPLLADSLLINCDTSWFVQTRDFLNSYQIYSWISKTLLKLSWPIYQK